MKVSIFLSIGPVLGVLVGGFAIHPRDNSPGVLAAPIWRRDQSRSVENDLVRRDMLVKRATSGTVAVVLDNPPSKLLYYANITIGTPGQPIALQIDTGSSDIWTEVATSELCQSQGNPCASGAYDNASSSSYVYVNSDFFIQYADSTEAVGDYGLETFNIGGAIIKNMEFGLGLFANATDGVMGVGFAANEAILQFSGTRPYPNLVDTMVTEKFIESRTFSLYLDDQDASTGVILFGGVDTDKFSGTLATFPINLDDTGTAAAFAITLTGLALSPPGGKTIGISASSLFPMSVVLDSGSTFMSLPSGVTQSLGKAMGATYSKEFDGYVLPNCDLQNAKGSLDFFFSGVGISIPYSELIVNSFSTDGSKAEYRDGAPICLLGVSPGTPDGIAILGDTFLRSTYVVYDLDNQEISIAATKFNVSASNIQVIPSGKNKIPSASAVASPTILVLGQSAIPTGPPPTGSGGVLGTITNTPVGTSSSAANGNGLFGSGTDLVFGLSTCMGIVMGMLLAL